MKILKKRFLNIFNLLLSAMITLFGISCKTQKVVSDGAVNNDAEDQPARRIERPEQGEPIRVLYGVPMTVYRVRGNVVNEQQEPIKNIKVEVEIGDEDNGIKGETRTDADGVFNMVVNQRFISEADNIRLKFSDPMERYQSDSIDSRMDMRQENKFRSQGMFQVTHELKKK